MAIIYSPSAAVLKDYPSYRLLDGGLVMGFGKTTTLLNSTVGGFGEGSIWNAGNFSYRETSFASDPHLTTAGGVKLYVNLNKYELKAEAFGIKFTGDDQDAGANAQSMQKALDWLESEGQGGRIELASEGHMKIDHAIQCRNGIIIDGRGSLTDNVLNRSTTSSKYTQDNCYLMGGFARHDDNDHSFTRLKAFEVGDNEIVLKTLGDAQNYQVGDIVWIIEGDTNFGSGGIFPKQSEISRIIGISGSVLQLEHPTGIKITSEGAGTMGVSPTGAWIANVDYRVSGAKGGGDMIGTRHIAKDVTLVHHRLRQSGADGSSSTSPFSARSGMYNGLVEDIVVDGMVSNLVFGNGYVNSTWKNVRGPYCRRAIELKFLSQNSVFEDIRAWKMPHNFSDDTDEDVPIAIGEKSRNIKLIRPWVEVGKWNNPALVTGGNLIAFSGVTDCDITDLTVLGVAKFSSVIAFPDTAVRCKVKGGRITAPASVSVENYGIDCEVTDVAFGDADLYAYRHNGVARGGRISSCHWPNGAPVKMLAISGDSDRAVQLFDNDGLTGIDNFADRSILVRGNTNVTLRALAKAKANNIDCQGYSISTTADVMVGTALLIPAGALSEGDTIEWVISGGCSGTSGAKTLHWAAFINAVPEESVVGELSSSCLSWELRISVAVNSTNQFITSSRVSDLTNGNVKGNVSRRMGLAFATSDIAFELTGNVATPGEILKVQTIRRQILRPGFQI